MGMVAIDKRCLKAGDKFLSIVGEAALLLVNKLGLLGSICKSLNIVRDDELLTPVFKLFMAFQSR
jgi:hypothetical protein